LAKLTIFVLFNNKNAIDMKTNYFFSQRLSIYVFLGSFSIMISSCSSYQNSSYYDNDGIYGGSENNKSVANSNENTQSNKYQEYFSDLNKDAQSFTKVDEYNATSNDSISNNAAWGSNPQTVTINVYDNDWGWSYWNNYWYGGYWGWGGMWGPNWGWGGMWGPNWGWGTGFWGPNWGWGWNNWYGNNNWCGGYYNNYYHSYAGGRRGSAYNGSIASGRGTNSRISNNYSSRNNNGISTRNNSFNNVRSSNNSTRNYSNNSTRTNTNSNSTRNNVRTQTSSPTRTYSPSSNYGGGRSSYGGGGSYGGGRSSGGGGGGRSSGGGGGRR
jgi:hypothetical protein